MSSRTVPAIILLALLPAGALAQAYPTKPIRILVGFLPGGGSDIFGRLIAQSLTERLGQQVVVENRPGAGANIVHVPYKGVGAVVPDLLAGQVQMMTVPIPPVLPLVQAGRLKALGVTTLTRSKMLPELPTIDESGLKGYDVTHWYGPFAPAATPRDIVNRLHNELAQAPRSPETVARIAKQGAEPGNLTLGQLAQFMRGETVKWSKAVKASGAKVE